MPGSRPKFPRLYAAPIIALGLGLVLTVVYAWLLDDAFVYFRYADNAAVLDAGLVFNQGEYLEGYTSPLWMLLLVVARLLGLRYWPVILTVALAGLVLTWLLAIRVNRRLSAGAPIEFHLPALWIASCYAVASHFTSGLETPLVQVYALAFAALVVEPAAVWLQLAVALGPLIRPELSLALAIAVTWCWFRQRRPPWALLLAGCLLLGGWLAFRIYYYADLFPNTFHLKHAEAPGRGLLYVHDTLRAYHLYALFGVVLFLLGVRAVRHGRHELALGPRAVLWTAALLHLAYVVWIGGDFVHYRYLAFPVLVLVASCGGVVERFLGPATRARRSAALAAGLGVAGLVACAYPTAQLPAHPLLLKLGPDSLTMYRAEGVEDAAAHRLRSDLWAVTWDRGTADVEALLDHDGLHYGAVVSTGWCRIAYAHLDAFVIQDFGLTDPVLPHVTGFPASSHAGHRWALTPLARDLVGARARTAGSDGVAGVYRRAVLSGRAPRWMARNVDALETIERRTRRPRAWWPNLVQAFEPWPEIQVTRKDVAAAKRSASWAMLSDSSISESVLTDIPRRHEN